MAQRARSDPLRGKDAHRSPHRGLRLFGLQRSALPCTTDLTDGMETADQAQQRISSRRAKEDQRPMEESTRDECAIGSCKAQSDYSWMGQLLPNCRRQRNL